MSVLELLIERFWGGDTLNRTQFGELGGCISERSSANLGFHIRTQFGEQAFRPLHPPPTPSRGLPGLTLQLLDGLIHGFAAQAGLSNEGRRGTLFAIGDGAALAGVVDDAMLELSAQQGWHRRLELGGERHADEGGLAAAVVLGVGEGKHEVGIIGAVEALDLYARLEGGTTSQQEL